MVFEGAQTAPPFKSGDQLRLNPTHRSARGKPKGQLISKVNCQAMNSSKKRMNGIIFTSVRCVFVRFLEEIEEAKKAFRNYLTFMPY